MSSSVVFIKLNFIKTFHVLKNPMIYCVGGICTSHQSWRHLKCFMFSIETQLFYVASSHLHSKTRIGVLYQFNAPAAGRHSSLSSSVLSKPQPGHQYKIIEFQDHFLCFFSIIDHWQGRTETTVKMNCLGHNCPRCPPTHSNLKLNALWHPMIKYI